tara:strand:+ start:54 stop:191 length:138 start_codon:yes stop_codon:yes gene_type:complete
VRIRCFLCDHIVEEGDDPTEEVEDCILGVGFNDCLCEEEEIDEDV